MPPLMQLPAYQVPRNALMDLSPISEAIDSNRANALAQQKMGIEQERLGMERKRLGMAEQSHSQAQQDAVRKRMGGMALLALQDADEAKQAAVHQQLLASHPNAAALPAHYRDPKTGLLAIVGDAGLAHEYIQAQIQRQAAARAAAADSRAAALHPLQLREAQIGLDIKQRELDTPKDRFQSVKEGETILRMPERGATGTPEVVYGPGQNGQPSIGDPKKRADIEHTMRGEVQKLSKDYMTVRDQSANLEGIAKNDTAAGDIALIFAYMKILDPSSVVRETEFATAQNATGIPDRIRNLYNKALDGQRLNPQQRQDFLNQARTISQKQLGQYQRTLDQYKGVAERTGVDFRNVVLDQEHLTQGGGTATGNATIGTNLNGADAPFMTPEQVAASPPGTWFKDDKGNLRRRK